MFLLVKHPQRQRVRRNGYFLRLVYECDQEMDIDSENDSLLGMLGTSKPENNVSECNTSDHLLKCDLHLGF